MTSNIKLSLQVRAYGASERGPLHASEALPNQDAWLKAEGSFGSLVVVCDGLGSRAKSHIGSQAACQATREAVVRWSKTKDAPLPLLVRLIELCWRLRIAPHHPDEMGTTCLFALRLCSGRWIVGGLGDGLLATVTGDEWNCHIGGRDQDSFVNETDALGAKVFSKNWVLHELSPTSKPRFAVLATDGISDDLLSEQTEAFCRWFCEEFGPMEPLSRWHAIRKNLRNWPTPKHSDDKTIAILQSI